MSTIHDTIEAQINALKNLEKFSEQDILAANEIIADCNGRVFFLGIGKSAIVAQKCNATFNSLGIRSSYLHASEAMHGDFGSLDINDVIIAFSYSGETAEVVKVVNHAKNHNIKVVSVTGSDKNSLSKLSDTNIRIKIDDEGSLKNLAPMASVIAMIATGDCLANIIASKRNFSEKNFAKNHPGGSLGLRLTPLSTIIHSNLPIADKNGDLFQILEIIDKNKLGITGITDSNGQLIGIITDGDIRRAILKYGNNNLTAQQIMTMSPKTIDISQNAFEALNIMEQYKITALFVTRDNFPIGIIHIHDILQK